MALHRPAEFNKSHVPAFLADEEPRDYVCVYPFVRSYEWYLLPDAERRRMLAEHGQMARDYKDVRANTVSSFALGDYEWILAFEADELHRIVDLMRHLRGSDARRHVREEVPFYTGRRRSVRRDRRRAAVSAVDDFVGLWRSQPRAAPAGPPVHEYVRLYDNGYVISASCPPSPTLDRWFAWPNGSLARGRFWTDGREISFETFTPMGSTWFSGRLDDGGRLWLTMRGVQTGRTDDLQFERIGG